MEKIIVGDIEIKPGMLLYLDNASTNSNDFYIVFLTADDLAIVSFSETKWFELKEITSRITAIRGIQDDNISSILDSGKLLWEKLPKITITKRQIAEKFNCSTEQLEII